MKLLGKRVDDRDADAVEAAGDLVAPALAELAAGVKDGQDDLGRGALLLGVLVDRDAAAVVDHGDRLVGVDRDLDVVAVAGQRLVDGVVDDLVDDVMEAAGPGRADVHARALAHRIEPTEDRDLAGRVVAVLGGSVLLRVGFASASCFCHLDLSGLPRGRIPAAARATLEALSDGPVAHRSSSHKDTSLGGRNRHYKAKKALQISINL